MLQHGQPVDPHAQVNNPGAHAGMLTRKMRFVAITRRTRFSFFGDPIQASGSDSEESKDKLAQQNDQSRVIKADGASNFCWVVEGWTTFAAAGVDQRGLL